MSAYRLVLGQPVSLGSIVLDAQLRETAAIEQKWKRYLRANSVSKPCLVDGDDFLEVHLNDSMRQMILEAVQLLSGNVLRLVSRGVKDDVDQTQVVLCFADAIPDSPTSVQLRAYLDQYRDDDDTFARFAKKFGCVPWSNVAREEKYEPRLLCVRRNGSPR